jgi:predicted DNA-binding protein (MmcQ/YjbR family)
MDLATYNSFCESLPHAFHVVQWGGAHVWNVGGATGKVFAVCWPGAHGLQVTFKCSAMSFDLLKERPGLRPAPYFASRGMNWVQRFDESSMDDGALEDYLRESHRLAGQNLTRAMRLKLGL